MADAPVRTPSNPADGHTSAPMDLTTSQRDPLQAPVDALAIAVVAEAPPSPLLASVDGLLGGRLTRALASGEARATPGATASFDADNLTGPARIVLVGVGRPEPGYGLDGLRTGAAAFARPGAPFGATRAWALEEIEGVPLDYQVRALAEGAILGSYDPGRWRSTSLAALPSLEIIGAAETATARRAAVVARWTNAARVLADTPPNLLTPAALVDEASTLLGGLPVTIEHLGPAELAAEGMGGVLAVAAGSAVEPRLLVVRYAPPQARADAPHLGLVGKGVTFDSGGLFLKQQGELPRQKADMGGAAAVIGAIGAIAELDLPIPVTCIVPAAENMTGAAAMRPSDVVRLASGHTVEVMNPDAEGRLILADALWYAGRESLTHLVDVATLTGAVRGALGDLWAAVLGSDTAWEEELVEAGGRSGDYAWRLPMHPRYGMLLESPVADLRNTGGRTYGYAIVAATFLQRFAPITRWAHVDIQSTAYLDDGRDYLGRGASGAGVRLLVEAAARLAGSVTA